MQSERSQLFGDRATVLAEMVAHARQSQVLNDCDLNAAAFHEAGHVVAAHRLDIAVRSVHVGRRDDGSDGATVMRASDRSPEAAIRMAPAHWAGFVAQSIWLGRRSWDGVRADMAQVAHSTPDAGQHQRLWHPAIERAADLLSERGVWADVEAVASALLARRHLDAAALAALLPPPTRRA